MNTLKSTASDDSSAAIVVSFDSKWAALLKNSTVSRIFRKRAPRKIAPGFIYAYIGSPVSALIGRCKVSSLDWLPTKEAIALAKDGAISEDELRRYAGDYESLAVYAVAPMQVYTSPLALSLLQQKFGFSPPQSFFLLSSSGQQTLDELAGFARRKKRGHR